jgi:hypothetical protein
LERDKERIYGGRERFFEKRPARPGTGEGDRAENARALSVEKVYRRETTVSGEAKIRGEELGWPGLG